MFPKGLTQLGLEKDAAAVRVPSHRLGPPETLTTVQYGNLIRAPDKRTLVGKRDHALIGTRSPASVVA